MVRKIVYCNYVITFDFTSLGGEQQLCQVSRTLWLHYSVSVKKSPPPFFDTHFYSTCNSMCLHRYGIDLNQGIDCVNWKEVYKYLQNNVS